MVGGIPESPAYLSQKFKPRLVVTKSRVIGEIASTPVYCGREPEHPLASRKRTSSLGQGSGIKDPADPSPFYRRATESLKNHSAAVGAAPIEVTSSFRPGPMVEEMDTFFM